MSSDQSDREAHQVRFPRESPSSRGSPILRHGCLASFASRQGLIAPLEALAWPDLGESRFDLSRVVGRELETQEVPLEFLGDHQGRATAGERVEHDLAGIRTGPDDPAQDLFGHLAAVPAGAFLECPANAGDVPRVAVRGEAIGDVLGAQDPGVVGEPAFGIGAGVEVHQLPRRRNANCLVVERAEASGP